MKKNIIYVSLFIISLMNSACTVLGGLAGSLFNNSEYTKKDREVLSISKDKSLEVYTMNGRVYEGSLVRIKKLTPEEYSNMYMDFLNTQDSMKKFPKLNETYFINQQIEPVEFKGLDFGRIAYRTKSYSGTMFIATDSIAFLKNLSGERIHREFLLNSMTKTKIPLYSRLILGNEEKINEIQSEDISKIISKNSTGTIIGGIIGAIIDVIIISSIHLRFQ